MDPLDFLVEHAPFHALSGAGSERLAAGLEITWARAGDRILERGEAHPWLYAVRKGHVRLELDGQRITELGPGEIFGLTSLAEDPEAPRLDALAESDCLLYRISCEAVRELCETEPRFARFFLDGLADRLRRLTEAQAVPLTSDLGLRVGDLVRRAPVTLRLDRTETTVGDAARVMERARVSSVLLLEGPVGPPVGILTDRDLRGRVLARGLGPDTPVTDVMTSPVESLDVATPGAEALLQLLRSGRHHLVLEDEGRLAGVVTHSDLLRRHLQSPAALLETIRSTFRAEDLEDYGERIATTVETLSTSGVEATDVGRVVAALNDALVSRLLDLTEEELTAELGPRPCDFAWIVFGSEGRQEQSFLTDQDNALVFAEPSESARTWFGELARRGVERLIRVGFPPCRGGFMATNWCLDLGEWTRRFTDWVERPEPDNLLRVANVFDWRSVHGSLDLEPLEAIVRSARDDRVFVAQLARASMRQRPPLGLLHRIVEDEGGVDLKSGALMPVSGLARLFALEAGERAGSTVRRLRRATRAGTVSPEGAEILTEAFRFVFGLRLRRQLADRRAERELSNRVELDDLSAAERRHLKEAFVAISRMQKATENRLDTTILG